MADDNDSNLIEYKVRFTFIESFEVSTWAVDETTAIANTVQNLSRKYLGDVINKIDVSHVEVNAGSIPAR